MRRGGSLSRGPATGAGSGGRRRRARSWRVLEYVMIQIRILYNPVERQSVVEHAEVSGVIGVLPERVGTLAGAILAIYPKTSVPELRITLLRAVLARELCTMFTPCFKARLHASSLAVYRPYLVLTTARQGVDRVATQEITHDAAHDGAALEWAADINLALAGGRLACRSIAGRGAADRFSLSTGGE